jgi:hypothetical protein
LTVIVPVVAAGTEIVETPTAAVAVPPPVPLPLMAIEGIEVKPVPPAVTPIDRTPTVAEPVALVLPPGKPTLGIPCVEV